MGNVDYVMKKINESFNEKFVFFAFEDFVLEMILDNPETYLGFCPVKIGRWWNNKEEIDLVAISEEKIAFIECKWQTQKVDGRVLFDLARKSELTGVGDHLEKEMVLFAKSGFTDGLEKSDGRFYVFDKV